MSTKTAWLTVDREGLGKLMERRGKTFAVLELLSNSLDAGARHIAISLTALAGPKARLVVEDDAADGFHDLTHAFTLFAESERKAVVTARGRFNLGNKLVLAIADEAEIVSTTGGVSFDREGRHSLRRRRGHGTRFDAVLRMTRAELLEVEDLAGRVIVPPGVSVTFNSVPIMPRVPLAEIRWTLPTELADAEGYLRRRMRETTVQVFEAPTDGGWLYELGIPICETGDRYHANILQKTPLAMVDRDNVPAAYLRSVRTAVLNATHDLIKPEDTTATWVRDALEDPRASDDAVRAVLTKQHGDKRVSYDPSDVEGTFKAQSLGYTVIPGGSYSKEAWENIRRAEAVLPAGQVTPSQPSPTAPTEYLKESDLTDGMRSVRSLAEALADELLDVDVTVAFLSSPTAVTKADWSSSGRSGHLRFNVDHPAMGYDWFNNGASEDVLALLLHEFAHHRVSNHLDHEFHRECCRLGARLALFTAKSPGVLR